MFSIKSDNCIPNKPQALRRHALFTVWDYLGENLVCGKNARGKIAIGKNVRGKIAIGKNVRVKVVKIP